MDGRHPLEDYEGPLRTRVGACFPGERAVYRGQDLHADLGQVDWLDLYVFGATGRRYGPDQLKVLNALWSFTSYPDTRIWNNRVAALAGTARSTGSLGMSAALAVSEAAIFGRQIDYRAIEFLQRARRRVEHGEDLAHVVEEELHLRRSLAGYGRPVASGDERMAPTRKLLEEVGMADGPALRLAAEIETILQTGRWRLKMNYAGLVAAIATELGMTPSQYYAFAYPAFLAGMQPCYEEAREKPAGAIMPMRCSAVIYNGAPSRSWP